MLEKFDKLLEFPRSHPTIDKLNVHLKTRNYFLWKSFLLLSWRLLLRKFEPEFDLWEANLTRDQIKRRFLMRPQQMFFLLTVGHSAWNRILITHLTSHLIRFLQVTPKKQTNIKYVKCKFISNFVNLQLFNWKSS